MNIFKKNSKENQKTNKKIWDRPWFWAVFIFFISFFVYFNTVCLDVYLEDSGELIAAVESLGVAHPPGYPLYVIANNLLSNLIPAENFAFQVNLLSGFWGALAVALLFLILNTVSSRFFDSKKEKPNRDFIFLILIPAATSLVLAFSRTFWSQSVFSEVYTLNVFLSLLLVFFLVRFEKKRQDKYIYWFFLVSGLGLTNHQMIIFLIPLFFLVFLFIDFSLLKNWRLWLGCLFLFFLGFSVYLFIPFTVTYLNPDMNWGNPGSLSSFVHHVGRGQYHDTGTDLISSLNDTHHWNLLHSLFLDILDNFNYLGVVAAFLGMIFLWFKNKKFFYILGVIFCGNGLALIFGRNIASSGTIEIIYRVYYLPVYSIVAVLIGVFLFALYYFLKKIVNHNKKYHLISRILFCAIVFLLPVSYFLNNFRQNDLSDFRLAGVWSEEAMASIKDDSFLMLFNDQPSADSQVFSLIYQHAVTDTRDDVAAITVAGIEGKFFSVNLHKETSASQLNQTEKTNYVEKQKDKLEIILNELKEAREVRDKDHFFGLMPIFDHQKNIFAVSNGYLYEYFDNLEDVRAELARLETENRHLTDFEQYLYEPLEYNMFYRDFVSEIFYNRAIYWAQFKNRDLVNYYFNLGVEYDWKPLSINFNTAKETINRYLSL